MTGDRIRCLVPACRRTAPKSRYPDSDEIICGRCWRTIEPALRRRYKQLRRREKFLRSKMQLKAEQAKPGYALRFRRLERAWFRSWNRMWHAIREDAQFKSAMLIKGTAGELAHRRKHGSPKTR